MTFCPQPVGSLLAPLLTKFGVSVGDELIAKLFNSIAPSPTNLIAYRVFNVGVERE
jgi:hypothetical protein